MNGLWERLFLFYEKLPAGIRGQLGVFISSPLTLRWLVLYIVIGFSGVAVYFGLLWVLLRESVPVLAATACSFFTGASLQFLLNRFLNFRAFDRTVSRQASTYAAIMALNFLLTMLIVTVGTQGLHMHPFLANVVTIPVTSPTAYLANRYMTFGPGIRARLREWVRVRGR